MNALAAGHRTVNRNRFNAILGRQKGQIQNPKTDYYCDLIAQFIRASLSGQCRTECAGFELNDHQIFISTFHHVLYQFTPLRLCLYYFINNITLKEI